MLHAQFHGFFAPFQPNFWACYFFFDLEIEAPAIAISKQWSGALVSNRRLNSVRANLFFTPKSSTGIAAVAVVAHVQHQAPVGQFHHLRFGGIGHVPGSYEPVVAPSRLQTMNGRCRVRRRFVWASEHWLLVTDHYSPSSVFSVKYYLIASLLLWNQMQKAVERKVKSLTRIQD